MSKRRENKAKRTMKNKEDKKTVQNKMKMHLARFRALLFKDSSSFFCLLLVSDAAAAATACSNDNQWTSKAVLHSQNVPNRNTFRTFTFIL